MKLCNKCTEAKSFSEFYKDIRCKSGISGICKECTKIQAKLYRLSHKDIIRAGKRVDKLKRRFGLTPKMYDQMLENQNYCCAICGIHRVKLSKNMAVDHDHSTGVVRALLCSSCNTSLGQLKEDVQILENMIAYINKHKETL